MAEPTLEEKLRSILSINKTKLFKEPIGIVAEFDGQAAICDSVDDAINWLYNVVKQEGFLK